MVSCDQCDKSFTNHRALNGHLRTHAPNFGTYQSNQKSDKAQFNCRNCGELKEFKPSSSTGKFCSSKCHGEYKWREESIPKILAGQGGNLKRFLTETRGYKCEICNVSEWQGQPLTLQLDHIDGDSDNNAVENMRLICPNCHSQTDTFTGRNKKNAKRNRYLQSYKEEKKQVRRAF